MKKSINPFSMHARASLTADERARMRARLMAAMQDAPVFIAAKPAPSPYAPVFSFGSFGLSPRFAYAVAAIILIIGISGGTAFAAEGSVPGDILYGVKTGVNEPVALALATTPQAKAETHAAIAVERLSEATTLASEGTLTASTSDALAASFITNASDLATIADGIATTDPSVASALRTNLSNEVAVSASSLLAEGNLSSDRTRIATVNLVSRAIASAIGDTSDAQDDQGDSQSDDQQIAIASSPASAAVTVQEIATTTDLAIAVSAPAPEVPQMAPASAKRSMAVATAASTSSAVPVVPASAVSPAMLVAPAVSAPMIETESVSVTEATASSNPAMIVSSLHAAAPPVLAALTSAIDAAAAHFNAASSTLDASSTDYATNALANARLISVKAQADASADDSIAESMDLARGIARVARLEAFLASDRSNGDTR